MSNYVYINREDLAYAINNYKSDDIKYIILHEQTHINNKLVYTTVYGDGLSSMLYYLGNGYCLHKMNGYHMLFCVGKRNLHKRLLIINTIKACITPYVNERVKVMIFSSIEELEHWFNNSS